MDKLTDTFIKNAGKSTEKPVVEYDAFTGKPVGDLYMTTDSIIKGLIGVVFVVGFIAVMVLGG